MQSLVIYGGRRVRGTDLPAWGVQLVYHHMHRVAAGKSHYGVIASILSILGQLGHCVCVRMYKCACINKQCIYGAICTRMYDIVHRYAVMSIYNNNYYTECSSQYSSNVTSSSRKGAKSSLFSLMYATTSLRRVLWFMCPSLSCSESARNRQLL